MRKRKRKRIRVGKKLPPERGFIVVPTEWVHRRNRLKDAISRLGNRVRVKRYETAITYYLDGYLASIRELIEEGEKK